MTTTICIGDPHFQPSNIPEVELFIKRIIALVEERKPTFVCVLGDVLHTHEKIFTIALNKAYLLIEKLSDITRTYVLVGNHDMINNQAFLDENHWMNAMKKWPNVSIVDRGMIEIIDDMKFVFVPYVPPGRFREALELIDSDWVNAKCIFAHQEFKGCKMGAITSEEGDSWSTSLPQIISGHIHSRQTLAESNVYYTGSAMQHAFGESEVNIIACIEFSMESKAYHLEEVDLYLPRKKIVYKDITDIQTYDPSIIQNTDDKVKLTLKGTIEEFKALKKTKKYKDLVDSGIKVVFKPRKIDTVLTEVSNDESEDRGNFKTILHSLVHKIDNKNLHEAYMKCCV